MRLTKITLALAGTLAVLLGLSPEARASGQGAAASCQISSPSRVPISMQVSVNLTSFNNDFTPVVDSISVLVYFHGQTFGPIIVDNVPFTNGLSFLDAACDVFNGQAGIQPPTSRLSQKILRAVGLHGKQINFTACSFFGPTLPNPPFDCLAPVPPGTPPGFFFSTLTSGGGLIIGYADGDN